MELPRRSDGSLDLAANLELVRAAAARLGDLVRRTPVVDSHTHSDSAGRQVFLKLENLQRTGSFKVRGSLNKVLSLGPEELARGLVAASAGNHAQGVALASRLAGAEATIVMPRATPLVKLRRTEDYGARVIRHGESWDEAQALALSIAADEGRTPVHPFDDAEVILGQGTLALEVLEQAPGIEALVLPVGGGGLVAGVALAVKALAPSVRVIGVQAAGADAMVRSFRSGARETLAKPRTIADGIRVGRPGERTLPVVLELVDDLVTVDDDEISAAVVETLQKSKVVAEPAGAAGVAAVRTGRVVGDGPVCVVISAGNVDLNSLGRMIESGLANEGFYYPLALRLPDVPGQLQRVLQVLTETESNIVDVRHYRSGWRVPVGFVDVEILLETRHAEGGQEIAKLMSARGFEVSGP